MTNKLAIVAAVAVGVAAGAVLTNTNDAEAQQTTTGPGEPYVIETHPFVENAGRHWLYRVWSDGAVDLHKILLDAQLPKSVQDVVWQGFLPLVDIAREDINGDGCVDAADLAQLLREWEPCEPIE